jgi:hypothetical protein
MTHNATESNLSINISFFNDIRLCRGQHVYEQCFGYPIFYMDRELKLAAECIRMMSAA